MSAPVSKTAQSGFSLLEVLVAIIVLAVGLLGYAGLQARALKNDMLSQQRSQATLLAYDMFDSMRVNRAAALDGSYNLAFGGTPTAGTVSGDDLVAFKQAVSGSLPEGDLMINVDATGNATIALRWNENGDSKQTRFLTSSRL